jgi:tetratricopeptide (TPR) repeat protein
MRDVLALQAEVAQAIARQIQIKLTPQEQAYFRQERSVDPEAYEAYLKGRYHWSRRSSEGVEKAAGCFLAALEKDENYAAALAGLADCANIAGWWCFVPPEEGCGKGKFAALQALAKDDSQSEAHASLGWSLLFYDCDLLGAEREFRRAIELNTQNASAVEWYACCLMMMGRADESMREIMRAVRVDPLSPIIVTVAGMLAYMARQYDQSIELCRRGLDLDSNFYDARWTIAASLSQKGLHQESIDEIEPVVRATNRMPLHLYMLGLCYANAGRHGEALNVIAELQEISGRRFVPAYSVAMIYAALKAMDQAFQWLEAAYHAHEPWMALTKFHPWLDNLRSDPRFDDLVRRLNFPDV